VAAGRAGPGHQVSLLAEGLVEVAPDEEVAVGVVGVASGVRGGGAELARVNGTTVSLDVNYRSRLWPPDQARAVLASLSHLADIAIGSADELALLTPAPDAASTLPARDAREVALKQGAAGATAETLTVPARPVSEVDPIGAGDSFVAGYLSAHLDGLDLPARLHRPRGRPAGSRPEPEALRPDPRHRPGTSRTSTRSWPTGARSSTKPSPPPGSRTRRKTDRG
jgi:hypothetical protein